MTHTNRRRRLRGAADIRFASALVIIVVAMIGGSLLAGCPPNYGGGTNTDPQLKANMISIATEELRRTNRLYDHFEVDATKQASNWWKVVFTDIDLESTRTITVSIDPDGTVQSVRSFR